MKRLLFLALLFFFAFLPQARAEDSPNFLVIQTDDLSYRGAFGTFRLPSGRVVPIMPRLQTLLRDQGVELNNFHVTTPLCAPSRASLLSGQLPHNNEVVGNEMSSDFGGGWSAWATSPAFWNNFLLRLQSAGYQTAHFGKMMNHYEAAAEPFHVPGWDVWETDGTDESTRDYYGYTQASYRPGQDFLIRGPWGSYRRPDPKSCSPRAGCRYHTDRMSALATSEIRFADKPFYVQVDYHTWHADRHPPLGAEPATRHKGLARAATLPRPQNWNERNVSDKPASLRYPRLTSAQIRAQETFWRNGIESLRSVDEGIGAMIRALREGERLDNTYIIFLSDNGFFLGEHRIHLGKGLPYRESARVPFLIRGPGLPAGSAIEEPASMIDIAPSILRWANLPATGLRFDGKPLQPVLQGESDPWRPLWISSRPPEIATRNGPGNGVRYRAVLIGPYKYILYSNGERELYDLSRDPHEEQNEISNPAYAGIADWMQGRLVEGSTCSEEECLLSPEPPPLGN